MTSNDERSIWQASIPQNHTKICEVLRFCVARINDNRFTKSMYKNNYHNQHRLKIVATFTLLMSSLQMIRVAEKILQNNLSL